MRLLRFCFLLTPLSLSAQDKVDSTKNKYPLFEYRMYDPRLRATGSHRDSLFNQQDTIFPYKFTNNPLFKTLDEVPDSLLYLLPDSTTKELKSEKKDM